MSYPPRSSLLQDVFRALLMTAIAVALMVAPRVVLAHAVLVQSSPSFNGTVHGPEVPVTLKFNSRVDGARSALSLVAANGQSKSLLLDKQSAPDTLSAHLTGLAPGKYVIHWQALAIDGHVTRGQVPFQVQ
jgi:methionine-rich copper-binding protein CopC